MTDKESWPEFLQRLNELYRVRRPGRKTAGGHELYLVDLSEWKLRFSDRTPLIWVRVEDPETLTVSELAESLRDVARKQGWRHRDCIVLLDRDGRELKAHTAGQDTPRLVIVDAADQQNILAVSSLTSALQDLIYRQIPISDLAPYEISKPVTGSRFFGRESEIRKVIRRSDTNFAVIGPRRIGKTSLLREIERRLKEQTAQQAPYIFLDCSLIQTPYAFVEALVQKLYPSDLSRLSRQTPEVFLIGFLDRMHSVFGSPITIFLDEVDKWFAPVVRDRRLLNMFRVSSESENCRYIAAGFTELMQEPHRVDSPFFKKSFEWIELGPFKKKDVEDLVLTPMRHLRIQFEQAGEVVKRITDETGGIPRLVQYYCLNLITRLNTMLERRIKPDSLSWIHQKDDFKTYVLGVFRDSVDARSRSLIYALLATMPEEQDTGLFTQQEMFTTLTNSGFSISPEEVDRICDRLILFGILTKEDNKYRFFAPIFPNTLRAHYNLDYLLSGERIRVHESGAEDDQ